MTDEANEPSFWQLHAGALYLNGLVVIVWGLCAFASQTGHDYGYIPLLAFFIALAMGTLGNFIGVVVNLLAGRDYQAAGYALGLVIVGSLLAALWISLRHSHIGKPPGG